MRKAAAAPPAPTHSPPSDEKTHPLPETAHLPLPCHTHACSEPLQLRCLQPPPVSLPRVCESLGVLLNPSLILSPPDSGHPAAPTLLYKHLAAASRAVPALRSCHIQLRGCAWHAPTLHRPATQPCRPALPPAGVPCPCSCPCSYACAFEFQPPLLRLPPRTPHRFTPHYRMLSPPLALPSYLSSVT